MEELLSLLKQKGWTIGTCESLTAGLFTSKMASISGASAVLKGGIVSYQTEVKTTVVKVADDIVKRYGVISEPCAREMASKAQKLLQCDVCVSFSGNAGPDVMEEKPAGCVYCAVAVKDHVYAYHFQLEGTRNEIREQVVFCMVEKIIGLLKDM